MDLAGGIIAALSIVAVFGLILGTLIGSFTA
jgi:predicted Co/Zn/Cd cation transporter (cation efflux family)